MNIPYAFKTCTKCGKTLPATTEYFYKAKNGKYGLESICKKCRAEQGKQYRESHKNEIAERSKQYYEDNKDKKKQYYKDNKDKKSEYDKQYYKDNKDKILEYYKQHYKDNKDKKSEYDKQYHATPQGQAVQFNRNCRRRAKEQNQGNGITKDQWLEMMNFFDWKCAYSDKYIGGNNNRSIRTIDHIISLSQGGEHEVWNCVPMDRGLNSSKQDKDMEEWYQKQDFYSEERLQKIYEWQEYAFNKYSKK